MTDIPNFNNPMSFSSSTINLKICSLNCRSIVKINHNNTSSDFIRHLRQQQYDILCLQESHVSDDALIQSMNIQFQTQSTIWSAHCGIVSLNPSLVLQPLFITLDQRVIACQINHANDLFPPVTIINIYAPASPGPRKIFYEQIMTLPIFQIPELYPFLSEDTSHHIEQNPVDTFIRPMVILGDFNYHANSYAIDNTNYTNDHFFPPSTQASIDSIRQPSPQHLWHEFLLTHFRECTHSRDTDSFVPTFRRGTSCSTIDYIYTSPQLFQQIVKSNIEFINPTWTDHAALSVTFQFSTSRQGKGLWRCHPQLTQNPYFVDALDAALGLLFQDQLFLNLSYQDKWDKIKEITKSTAQKISRRKNSWQQRTLRRLQKKRNLFLRTYKSTGIRNLRLPIIENMISVLQQNLVDTASIRASCKWRENGEISAGYLKRTIATRAIRKNITSLQHPVDNDRLCHEPLDLQSAVTSFYQHLYTPDAIHQSSVDHLLDTITTADRITTSNQDVITEDFTLEDITHGAHRAPKHSSPGIDGLSYEILSLLLSFPDVARLAIQVYNEALNFAIFPDSWYSTCICLLPKKGDLTDLRNWRPISLINADAKVFTRLLNARLMPHFSGIISPQQTGFMPRRFIAEHGATLQTVTLLATAQKSSSIALLLDQNKAYDRIHPDYLSQVMEAFGIPSTITQCIISLFFTTQIQINVNGHITQTPFTQLRGLRQGDPLSPLLFNIAFDPFIRSIQQNESFKGFDFHHEAPPPPHLLHQPAPTSVKILAYADDTLVFLQNQQDFVYLQEAVTTYAQASNSLLNYDKTKALSLSGQTHPEWSSLLASYNITNWHNNQSPSALIYLGFAICSNTSQRNLYFDNLCHTIRQSCFLHQQRRLSIRGRATVLNTLIFSRLWHVMRLLVFTKAQLITLRGIGSKFINLRIFPRLAFDTIQLHRKKGGLGILDPIVQQHALQWRWVQPLLRSDLITPTSSTSFLSYSTLRYVFHWIYSSPQFPTYQFSLIFSTCRSSPWASHALACNLQFINIFTNFFRTVDLLPRSFDRCHINISTCLTLPFTDIITHFLPESHPAFVTFIPPQQLLQDYPGAKKLLASDIFHFNHELQIIQLRHPVTDIVRFRNISRFIINLVKTRQILLQPFFHAQCIPSPNIPPALSSPPNLDLTPFSTSLRTGLVASTLPINSIKYFKVIIAPTTPSLVFQSNKWCCFWRLKIPLHARTIWYRTLHNKLPTRSILHRFIPNTHPSPSCPLCSSSVPTEETTDHFLFLCPLKVSIWTEIYHTYISPIGIPQTISSFWPQVLSFSLPDYFQRDGSIALFPDLCTYQIFACTIQSIWSAHWRFIFDNTPFRPHIICNTISKQLSRLDSELQLADSE